MRCQVLAARVDVTAYNQGMARALTTRGVSIVSGIVYEFSLIVAPYCIHHFIYIPSLTAINN